MEPYAMIDEALLADVLPGDVSLRLVEPHIYSLYPPGESTNAYDELGTVYDLVACNRLYNRFVWGYWIDEYATLCQRALTSSTDGWVLDAGCGSLAFTARTYVEHAKRPVILLDQSVKMLRLAKSRLVKLNGKVPSNLVFLHGDVLRLPFKPKSFDTIVSMNVLHVLNDVRSALRGLRRVLRDGGTISFTTLVENDRFADRYIQLLGRKGHVVPRNANQLMEFFQAESMPVTCRVRGNLAFISYG